MTHDLGIEGGTAVAPSGMAPRNVYVDGERITLITEDRRPARQRVAADGLLVMPGMVDTHVHLMDPGATEREDFPSGTAAAAVAGVTTVIEHTHSSPVRTVSDLARKQAHVASRSLVDFGLAAHAWPERLDEIPGLWRAGISYFKAFTCTTHGVPGFDAAALLHLLRAIRQNDAACLVHAEDATMLDDAERRLRAAERIDPSLLPEWRHRDAEVTALALVALLARRAGARVTAAHVSHPEALDVVARERAAGADLATETCPQYLTLLEDDVGREAGLRKFTPPARARDQADMDGMWHALSDGRVTIVSSDHAPSTRSQKADGSIWDVHFGLPGLDTTLPILLDAAATGRITYSQLVALYAVGPAALYRLAMKGRLEAGADADILLVDPNHTWTVHSAEIRSKAGWSPFEGRTLTGRSIRTYLRGRLIANDGQLAVAPGAGRFVPGPGWRT